ncbi:probable protein S-acyltransferase 12 [Cucurbita moschata]|uniref:Probable protein S-acyltransferase 12 n=1 Tax=Cucurbita moschata TaxID=3662 RepID=A0A6J1EVJ2_CUCMO|nr:probable protein S-acyltransferase 12 [Cucurbita moschata]
MEVINSFRFLGYFMNVVLLCGSTMRLTYLPPAPRKLYTFLETTMDTLVLLPSFIEVLDEAKSLSSSPANLVIIFLVLVLNLAFALSLFWFVVMHASPLMSNPLSIEVVDHYPRMRLKKKFCPWKCRNRRWK